MKGLSASRQELLSSLMKTLDQSTHPATTRESLNGHPVQAATDASSDTAETSEGLGGSAVSGQHGHLPSPKTPRDSGTKKSAKDCKRLIKSEPQSELHSASLEVSATASCCNYMLTPN